MPTCTVYVGLAQARPNYISTRRARTHCLRRDASGRPHPIIKDRYRYWVGILLLARCVLLLVFFTFTVNGDGTALVAISVAVVILAIPVSKYRSLYLTILEHSYVLNLVILAIPVSKYRSLYLTILEHSYVLSLGILSIVTGYLKLSSTFSDKQKVLITLSIGIAIFQFLSTILILYHAYTQLRELVIACVENIQTIRRLEDVAAESGPSGNDSNSELDSFSEQRPVIPPTTTEIHLSPPEQERQQPPSDSEAEDDSDLREPLPDYLTDD